MKIILFILFAFTLQAQNVWYVDRDTPAADWYVADGKSWATAWKYLDSTWNTNQHGNDGIFGINWTVIGDGDTIYISGGEDSTVYPGQSMRPALDVPITFNEPVIIRPAWHEGHNGDVYFTNTGAGYTSLSTAYISNIKFYDFTFNSKTSLNVTVSEDSLVGFYNCHILAGGTDYGHTGFTLQVTSKVTIDNCIIEELLNSSLAEGDMLTGAGGRGGHTFSNNLIIRRNAYTSIAGGGASVTTTDTSLIDTDLNMTINYHVGAVLSVADTTFLYPTSHTANTFYGTGWTDANGDPASAPPNGSNYTVFTEAHRDILQVGSQTRNSPVGRRPVLPI